MRYIIVNKFNYRRSFLLIFSIFFLANLSWGQKKYHLLNASFEGKPQDATVPVGWHGCEEGTTPDILPGPWNVFQEASEGDTYIGLITRDDGSWESIGQRLQEPLDPNECYSFEIDLAHSGTYAGYSQPVRLRVWGGMVKCNKTQLLFETGFIKHSTWKTYEAEFSTKARINYIIIEAYYSDSNKSHKGNILIDNMTPVKRCPRA